MNIIEKIGAFFGQSGFWEMFTAGNDSTPWYKYLIMYIIIGALFYLAIVKKFEPLLLLPIAFGMLLTNLPGAEMFHEQLFAGGHVNWTMFAGAEYVDIANLVVPEGWMYYGAYPSGEVYLFGEMGSAFIGTLSGISLETEAP